jgi:hypothetical protein
MTTDGRSISDYAVSYATWPGYREKEVTLEARPVVLCGAKLNFRASVVEPSGINALAFGGSPETRPLVSVDAVRVRPFKASISVRRCDS